MINAYKLRAHKSLHCLFWMAYRIDYFSKPKMHTHIFCSIFKLIFSRIQFLPSILFAGVSSFLSNAHLMVALNCVELAQFIYCNSNLCGNEKKNAFSMRKVECCVVDWLLNERGFYFDEYIQFLQPIMWNLNILNLEIL